MNVRHGCHKSSCEQAPVLSIVGSTGIPARYGGFETTAEALARHLSPRWRVKVYGSTKTYQRGDRASVFPAILRVVPLRANGWQSPFYDAMCLFLARKSDAVLLLGVSGGWFVPLLRFMSKARIVVNVDGIESRRKKWGYLSRLLLRGLEKLAVYSAHRVISDNQGIAEYLWTRYHRRSKIIPYGGDPIRVSSSTGGNLSVAGSAVLSFVQRGFYVAVSRIEPENHSDLILEAISSDSRFRLLYVGNWDHARWARNLREKFQHVDNIMLMDPIYDRHLLDSLRGRAVGYIHGHSAGGTNPSLVEAMWMGLPVFAYSVDFNRYTTENKAMFFDSVASLRARLASTSPTTMTNLGEQMREIADRRYTWRVIANDYHDALLPDFKPNRTSRSAER